jgi:hypothetical protein
MANQWMLVSVIFRYRSQRLAHLISEASQDTVCACVCVCVCVCVCAALFKN